MNNHCECGGFLGTGSVDGYGGRWCKCVNPKPTNNATITTTGTYSTRYIKTIDKMIRSPSPDISGGCFIENEVIYFKNKHGHTSMIIRINDYKDLMKNDKKKEL